MAHGAPDWVRMVQVAVTVDLLPVVPEPATELAAGDTGRVSTSSTSYQEVARWTVATNKVGELKELTVVSNEYGYTYFKVTINSVTFAEDWLVQSAMPLVFEDLKLAEGSIVKVEAKSTDGTAIVVDAVITGKEIG